MRLTRLRILVVWLTAHVAISIVALLAYEQLASLSGRVPGLTLALLLVGSALIWRYAVSDADSRKVVAALVVGTVTSIAWSLLAYALASEICSGTGTGGNQALRLCQAGSYFPVLVMIIASMLLTLATFHFFDLSVRARHIGILAMTVVWLILGTLVWFQPFLRVPVG